MKKGREGKGTKPGSLGIEEHCPGGCVHGRVGVFLEGMRSAWPKGLAHESFERVLHPILQPVLPVLEVGPNLHLELP